MVMQKTLTDGVGMPRFWPAVWDLLVGGSLVSSTFRAHHRDIETLYRHTELTRDSGILDDAIGKLDMPLIEEILEAYSIELRSFSSAANTPGRRWRHCFLFIKDICERIARTPAMTAQFEDLRLRLERLDRLYGHLYKNKKSKTTCIRALPATVLEELYAAVIPGSPTNPFKSDAAQWRVYAVFLLLLHQGLRRSETLILPVDFLKSERIQASGIRKYWLNVRTNEYEDDETRYSVPSIKTVESIRQIPVTVNQLPIFSICQR